MVQLAPHVAHQQGRAISPHCHAVCLQWHAAAFKIVRLESLTRIYVWRATMLLVYGMPDCHGPWGHYNAERPCPGDDMAMLGKGLLFLSDR